MPRQKSPKLIAFTHLMAAVTLFSKGIGKADDLPHNWPYVVLLCSLGILILLFVLYHHRIKRTSLRVPPLVSLAESIALFAVGYYSLRHGQHLLPYAWFLAAAMTAAATVIQLVALRHQKA